MSEPTLAEVYRTVQRIEKVLIVGNGTPPLVTIVAKLEEQADNIEKLLAYDRLQIDALREASRLSIQVAQNAHRNSSRWGAAAGGFVSVIAGILIAVADAIGKK